MIQVEASITIDRPIKAVLAVASNPATRPSWQWGCARTARVATEPLEPAGLRPAEKLAEAAMYEAGSALDIQGRRGEVVCEAAYHFDAISDGTCVTWSGRITASGRYELVEAQIGQLMAMEAEISLRLLKNLLEGEPHPHLAER